MSEAQDAVLKAARDVVRWAESLGYLAADGAAMAPVFVRLRDALKAIEEDAA
jgi:hypothetical protein